MSKCKQCQDVELTGKQQDFCSDRCRMWNKRHPNKIGHQVEQTHAERTNPNKLNWEGVMDTGELARAGLTANHVSIPGDHDYQSSPTVVHSNPRPLPSYQLPDGVTKPTGAMSDATRGMSGQELNQRANYYQGQDWIASPEYAEMIYRLMTGQVEGLWLPSWYSIRQAS